MIKDSWLQGYACAVACLQRLDGSKLLTTEVKELMKAGGLNVKACVDAGVDPFDMYALFGEDYGV